MKKKMTITGDMVTDVGYRPFLLGVAESLEIKRFFADNITISGRKAVYALVDSTEEKVKEFINIVSLRFPEGAVVEKVAEEDYDGEAMKIENYYRYLSSVQLSKISTYGGRMLEKQDMMLEKQEEHIAITKKGFAEVITELRGFRELHKELRELRGSSTSSRNPFPG